MRVLALVGTSGTGKSHKALSLAHKNEIECIIDDGLLIKDNKIIAGKSAKREKTTISAVKRALFLDDVHKNLVIEKLGEIEPESILILGTSDKMVKRIAENLEIKTIDKTIYIDEISTSDEINKAKNLRSTQGKHVIPVPTFEIKKDFSGYFINPLKLFQRRKDNSYYITEKSVVRPTFSYLGKYLISDKAINQIIVYSCSDVLGLYRITQIGIVNYSNGSIISIDVILNYGYDLKEVITTIQRKISKAVEDMASLNIISINVNVKSLKVNKY